VFRDVMADGWIEISEAAGLLDVRPGRVRQLVSAGDLAGEQRSGRWWVRFDGVQRMAAVERNGRPFSPRTAWAVLASLTPDLLAPVLDRRQAWRVDRYVADLRASSDVGCLRRRGNLVAGRVHPGLLNVMRDSLVLSGSAALPSNLAERLVDDDRIDGYLGQATWESLRADVPVSMEGHPNLFIRVVDEEVWPFPTGAHVAPVIVGAVDLLEHADGRSRRAGRAAFTSTLPHVGEL